MRELTLVQAADEIRILDRVSNGLRDALRQNYEDLRTNSPAVTRTGGDIEFAARVLERRFAARKRQDAAAIKATTPVPGQYKTSRPLEVIQIDHTLVDLVVVDEETRAPLGRPWLTLAIDVFTRTIVGFHLSMDPPSRLSVSLCLLHAVYDKTDTLTRRGCPRSPSTATAAWGSP